MSLEQYWDEYALPTAKKLVANIYPKITTASFSSVKDQFPFIEKPTPLQQYATTTKIVNEPQLFILEDVTGQGKRIKLII